MNVLSRLYHKNIAEVENDAVLRIYGAFLALADVWLAFRLQGEYLHRGAEAICWPLIPSCGALHVPTESAAAALLWMFSGGAAVIALLFLRRRTTRIAFNGLTVLLLIKLGILAIDFRMRHNAHYMAILIVGAYLFLPSKRDLTRLLLVLFYVAAGTLKLNWEWLSGEATGPFFVFSGRLLIAACAYAVLMELVIVWGMLSRRPQLFWFAFANLIAFHLISWPAVGFFYPLVMFCLLAIFPLVWFDGTETRSLAEALRKRTLPPVVVGAALCFCLLQVVPYLYPGDARITGEGRLYALHMIDARVICTADAIITHTNGSARTITFPQTGRSRTGCDPIILYNRARNLCNNQSPFATDVHQVHIRLRSRLATEHNERRVVDVADFCGRGLVYHPFLHNAWITDQAMAVR